MRLKGEANYFGNARTQGCCITFKTHCSFLLLDSFSYDTLWVLIKDSLGIMGEKKTMGVMKMECSPLWAFCFLKHPHDFYIL